MLLSAIFSLSALLLIAISISAQLLILSICFLESGRNVEEGLQHDRGALPIDKGTGGGSEPLRCIKNKNIVMNN